MNDAIQNIPPLDTASQDFIRGIGQALQLNQYVASRVPPRYPSCARRVRDCGRFAVKRRPIELCHSAHGYPFMTGVNRCHSRLCRWCHSSLMGVLATHWAARAREAERQGLGCAMVRFSVEACEPGELNAAITSLLTTFRNSFPSPSRLPKGWSVNGLALYIGMDWNVAIEWDKNQNVWLPHMHAMAFKDGGAWTETQLAYLRAQWQGSVEPYAEVADSAEAAARYAVKASNPKPDLLDLFDLADMRADLLVEEYLDATITLSERPRLRTLRSMCRKLSKLLRAKSDLTDEDLARSVDAQRGGLIATLTEGQWRQATGDLR